MGGHRTELVLGLPSKGVTHLEADSSPDTSPLPSPKGYKRLRLRSLEDLGEGSQDSWDTGQRHVDKDG